MITKLKELTAIFEKGFSEDFLSDLQELGIAHLERSSTEAQEPTNETLKKIYKFKKFLYKKYKEEELKKIKQEKDTGVEELLNKIDIGFQEIKRRKEERKALELELHKAEPFGDITDEQIEELKEFGLELRFYHLPIRLLTKVETEYEIVYEFGDNTVLISVFHGEELPYNELYTPSKSHRQLLKEIEVLNKKCFDGRKKLYEFAKYYELLEEESQILLDTLDFIKVKASVKNVEDLVSIVKFWIPAKNAKALIDKIKSYGAVAYDIVDAPYSKDTPVLLKNNRFAKMFEMITGLFSLPNYEEVDLTPFFAPFFTMFFGICVGDAGYGLGILVMSLFFLKKNKLIANLGIIFSLSVMFWGILTGTVFGVSVFEHPIPILSKLAVFRTVHMFYFALLVGLFQIFFGMILRAIYLTAYRGFKYALGSIGWIILLFAVVGLYLRDKTPADGFIIGEFVINFYKGIAIYLKYPIYLGVALILLFNDMSIPWYKRIGKGIWDLYGITGFFGDLLSYIRLFALGISSAILGTVINSLAESLLKIPVPGLREVSYFLFLFVGHFGNMLLALLGAFVHSLRLTFVEFYKNAGFEGGGKKFIRFKKTVVRR